MTDKHKIIFNRQEFSGAFGDIGTDFPLLVAMIIAAKLHAPSVFIFFGILQIFTGLIYKMPIPVQPLKAMATLVIAQQIGGPILLGAGLAIGVIMLILSISGLLKKIAQLTPLPVIRGIQIGLGLTLILLATQKYILSDGWVGYMLAMISFIVVLIFIDNQKVPASLVIIFIGIGYAFFDRLTIHDALKAVHLNFPELQIPTTEQVLKGFVILAIPQLPLSIGNSILATHKLISDLYPDQKDVSINKIGFTYSFMNILAPFFNGVPCCHGAGGLVGHYVFGGRTGASVIIYGIFYVILGLFFGSSMNLVIHAFPLPVLGTILLFEGISVVYMIKDIYSNKRNLLIAIITAGLAIGLPYGFFIAILVGTILYYLPIKFQTIINLNHNTIVEKNN